jgi:hypothetical protein
MTATIEYMYAAGPLVGPSGEILAETPAVEVPAPLTATITVRCTDRDGRDLATPIIIRPDQPLATEALRRVIRDREHGSVSADRFGHAVFNALRDLDERDLTGRDKAIQRRLRELDRLAIAGFEHDGTISW